jgi:hypothetical protein
MATAHDVFVLGLGGRGNAAPIVAYDSSAEVGLYEKSEYVGATMA